MRATTKLLQNGRVTLPHHVRESMGLSPGDYVEIEVKRVEVKKDE
jgi:AbrB family looped-hinge helix DNA binding protein